MAERGGRDTELLFSVFSLVSSDFSTRCKTKFFNGPSISHLSNYADITIIYNPHVTSVVILITLSCDYPYVYLTPD